MYVVRGCVDGGVPTEDPKVEGLVLWSRRAERALRGGGGVPARGHPKDAPIQASRQEVAL